MARWFESFPTRRRSKAVRTSRRAWPGTQAIHGRMVQLFGQQGRVRQHPRRHRARTLRGPRTRLVSCWDRRVTVGGEQEHVAGRNGCAGLVGSSDARDVHRNRLDEHTVASRQPRPVRAHIDDDHYTHGTSSPWTRSLAIAVASPSRQRGKKTFLVGGQVRRCPTLQPLSRQLGGQRPRRSQQPNPTSGSDRLGPAGRAPYFARSSPAETRSSNHTAVVWSPTSSISPVATLIPSRRLRSSIRSATAGSTTRG